ncbi:AAA family ATPase [uncultured Pontibacter sp.]|uniref:AAA family ATPase n=1 Tax=uncultured Pontibacter sp. TaxID=453356 RepID=UPI00262DE070|nr:AAA family ATPase [uncultured Pontibacter sp.]
MRHLQKISISNARRFGKDIEVELGQGATILLAPNGTGKTTVFEAIEFALTGAIQRLDNPPLSLIRENQLGLDVRLDFTNGKYCEVEYRKGNEPVLRGDHQLLFKNQNPESIPFLLRLTHLLEQRGKSWFVGADMEAAGSLLDRISIGRELNQVSNKRISVLKAANKEIDGVKVHFDQARQNLSHFESILNKRNQLALDIKIVPFEVIVSQIQDYYNLIIKEERLSINSTASGIATLSQIQSVVIQKIKESSDRLIQFTEVENLTDVYHSNLEGLNTKEEAIKDLNDVEERLKSIQEKIIKELKENISNLSTAREELNFVNEIRNLFTQQEANILEKEQIEKEVTLLTEELPVVKDDLKSSNEELEKAKALSDKQSFLNLEIEKALKAKGQLSNLEELRKKWSEDSKAVEELSKEIVPRFIEQKLSIKGKLDDTELSLTIAQRKFNVSEKGLNSLKEASDAIQGAVSTIAANIPQDRRDCPVCGADYEPGDLQERISSALEIINPLVSNAVLETKKAAKHLDDVKKKYIEEKGIYERICQELENHEEHLREIKAFINENILPNFPAYHTPNDALLNNQIRKIEVDNSLLSLYKEKDSLGEELTSNRLSALTLKQKEFERRVEQIQSKLNNYNLRVSNIVEDLNTIQRRVGEKTKELIQNEINDKEAAVRSLKETEEKLKAQQQDVYAKIEITKKQIVSEKELIAQFHSQQNIIRHKWINAGLPGEPARQALLEDQKLLVAAKDKLLETKVGLNKIEEELSRWKAAETYKAYDSEIKKIASPEDEEVHLEKLKEQLKKSEERYQFVQERTTALNDLFSNVKSELDTVHEYIKSVNPLWCSLLKRVVVNPRFAETALNSYSRRNKPLAGASTKLHGIDVNVADIASEAQLTDLQLTFMLAMAKEYQWTPWKALLLDDPTQHHDLVHSAAVFDLLRDYIVDLDFQVLLGTHDSVQANFFKRKLNNDGVDARILALRADDNGVKAEYV